MEKLALFGGPKTITTDLKPYHAFGHTYGEEEVQAAANVIRSGVLSKYIGSWGEAFYGDFYGGPKVKEFEQAWKNYFGVKHVVSVNSATSGLIAAIGALGVEPGDEVIVSPWTMAASATAILVWNAIPVFADIEPETFNLDLQSIKKNITPRTKAIVVPDIFGHSADIDAIMALAKEHGLKVIEDAAQSPGAQYKNRFVGTTADIGIYSLNYHKHIHTGEGGMCVTNDPVLAERMQLIRNHAENVVSHKPTTDFTNMIGFNFRLGEIECAIGLEQLKKLKWITESRQRIAARLDKGLSKLHGLKIPTVKNQCTHVYYTYPIILDIKALGVSRARIFEALEAEGVTAVVQGYSNVHLLPIYQKRIAYGSKGFPWTAPTYKGDVSYNKGICPVAETLHDTSLIYISTCSHAYSDTDIDQLVQSFEKVWAHLDQLK